MMNDSRMSGGGRRAGRGFRAIGFGVRATAAVAASTLALGCASIGSLPPQTADEPIRIDRGEAVLPRGGHAKLVQNDTLLTIEATRSCDVYGRPVVNRITTTESQNNSAWADWTFGVSGAALVGGGGYTILDGSKVYPKDRSSRTYNPVGPDAARALGVAEIALGLGLITIVVVDAVRANHVTVDDQEVTARGKVIKSDVACSRAALAKAELTGVAAGRTWVLGTTDANGKLVVDLDAVVDAGWVLPTPSPPMSIRIKDEDEAIGSAKLESVYVARRGRAWAGAGVAECKVPKTSKSCDSVKGFVASYPGGAHAKEARELLDLRVPELLRLAQAEAWSKVSLAGCAYSKAKEADEVGWDCSPLRAYLADFPSGEHAAEVEAALAKGDAIRKKLRAKEDAAAAAKKKKEEAEEAAVVAAAAVEKKKEADAEKKAAAKVRQKCVQECADICMLKYGSYTDKKQACTNLCTSQQCD